jgi:8-oxo-dGTP diphosphatase
MTQPRVGVGCIVRRGSELLLVRRHGAHGDGTWSTPGGVTLWFEADYVDGDAHARADDELSEVGWFSEVELPEPLFLPMRNRLDGRSIV